MILRFGQYGAKTIAGSAKPLRLSMNILVKNEVDIIAENIRVHSALGVDSFNVMDNGSTDGTRELLRELSNEYDINVIDQPDQNYKQAKWMTELNWVARSRGAHLVFNNDADEFYLPLKKGGYRAVLKAADSVVSVSRFNMALGPEALATGYKFWDSEYIVRNPVLYSSNTQIECEAISMLLVKISPKVITNPYGLIRLKGGNHRAKHVMNMFNGRLEPGIEVFHYPVRSFDQFKVNVENRKELLRRGARMGDHYRRWVKLYDQGKLEEEFERIVLSRSEVDALERVGVVELSELPRNSIVSQLR